MTRTFLLVSFLLLISIKGSGQCKNSPTVTLTSTSGSTCGTTPVTVSGNTFGGSATKVTITENGKGTVSPASANKSPFSFTYTPLTGDIGHVVIVTVTTDNPNGFPCIAASSKYTLTVNPIPSAPVLGTITNPTCTLATGSVVLSGLPSSGTWTLTRTPGGITNTGTGTSTTISGLSAGTYTYTVASSAGCTSVPSLNVVINVQPASPASPEQTVDCTLGFGKAAVAVTSPTGTGLQYRLDAGVYQNGTSFTNVANGNHTITVRNSSLCTTTGISFLVSCGCVDGPTVALSATSGSTCGITPLTVSGNTFGGNATSVTITENGAGSVSPVTTSTKPFAFTYTPAAGDAGNTVIITITTNNPLGSPCSPATATYTLAVNANPSAPVVGAITHPTCSVATGSVVLNGLPASGTWTVTRTPGGVTTTGSGTSASVSGFTTGTYNFSVTNSAGCSSAASANVVVNAQPSTPTAPVVGTINNPTCGTVTGSVVLSGLPSSGTWTLTRSPGGVTTTGTGTSSTLSGIAPGTYNYTVTSSTGCTSSLSANVVISSQPESPTSPTQTIDCSLGYSKAIVTVTSPTGTGIQYSLNGGAFQSGTSFNNVANGSHSITARNSSGCTTTGITFSVSCGCVNPPAVTLSTSSGSACGITPVTVSGNTFGGSATSVSITENGAGTVTPATSTTQPFAFTYTPAAGDAGKTVIITLTTNNPLGTPCAAATVFYILTVNGNSSTPAIGAITQPTCSIATGSVVLSSLPASGIWILTRNPDGVTTTGTGAGTTVTGLTPGTYTFTVTNAGGCISTPSGNVVIVAQASAPPPPVPGTITPPTCTVSTGSVLLNGLPSTGSWTLVRTPGGVTTTGSGTSTTVSNLAEGTYTYTVNNSIGCISSSSGAVVIPAQPLIPAPPGIGNITQPTCSVSTGSAVLNNLPASGTWILTRYPGTVTSTGTGTNITISGLSPGTYNFTVTNAAGCLSAPSANAVIPGPPGKPTAPAVGAITFPTCSGVAGSVVLNGLPSGNWTINPGGISGSGTSTLISGLSTGSYSYTVTNSAGCTSEPSSNVVIPAQPAIPTLIITNPAAVCSPLKVDLTAAAITTGSTPGLTFTYWTNAGATTSYPTPSSADAGTYFIKGTSLSGCIDIKPVTVTVNQLPAANAGAGGNECDLNFNFNAVASTGTGTWTKTTGPGTATFAPNSNTATASVTVSEYGTYTFTWAEINGTCTNSSTITVNFTQQPIVSAGAGGNNCGLEFYMNALINVGTGTWTKVSGPGNATFSPDIYSTKALVTVNAFGSYTFRWTAVNGTCTDSAPVTVTFVQSPTVNAGSDGEACDKAFILNASVTTGTGAWTKISGPGDAVFTPDNHQPNANVTVSQVGTYDFAWTVENSACTSSDIVRVVFHDLPQLSAGTDTVICKGGSIQLHASGTGSFLWTPPELVNNPYTADPVATPLITTTFTVNLTDQNGCINSDDVIVEVREKPVANAGPDQALQYLFKTTLEAKLAHNYETGVWSLCSGSGMLSDITNAKTAVTGLSLGENKFSWTVKNGVCSVTSDTVMITVRDVVVPTLITPNMDGKNDYFILKGFSIMGRIEIVIFDRRGAQVYKNVNYNNTWDGVDYNNKPLPDDTYFYVLKTENGKSISSYIVVRR